MSNTPDSQTLTVEQVITDKNFPVNKLEFSTGSSVILRSPTEILTPISDSPLNREWMDPEDVAKLVITDVHLLVRHEHNMFPVTREILTVTRMDGGVLSYNDIKPGDQFIISGNAQVQPK